MGTIRALAVVVCLLGLALSSGVLGCKKTGEEDKEKEKAATVGPPTIDGDLSDSAWKGCELPGDWTNVSTGEAVKTGARVFVACDEVNLYIAFLNPDADMKTIMAEVTDDDDVQIWLDEANEIFLDPTGKRETYYHLIINTNKAIYDARVEDKGTDRDESWASKATVAVKKMDDGWSLEVAIPLASLEVEGSPKGQTWAANFCRDCGHQDEESVFSAWANTGKRFHTPAKFKDLVLE